METWIWEQTSSKATPALQYCQGNKALGLAPCAQVDRTHLAQVLGTACSVWVTPKHSS